MNFAAQQQLRHIIERFADQPVLVVGDLILDQFVWGKVDRISPEAPVPVVEVVKETVRLGGAANVASNLAAMGSRPLLVGAVGRDEAGRELIEQLQEQGITSEGVVEDSDRTTSIKTRIIAHHQQVCRADRESREALSEGILKQLWTLYGTFLEPAKAIVISDYAKGTMSSEFIRNLIRNSRRHDKFVAIDPKSSDFSAYREASIVTPNAKEAEEASGFEITDEDSLTRAGTRILEITGAGCLLVTRGEEGMTLFQKGKVSHIPTAAREVFDVTGAGDTVIAALTLAVTAGASIGEAATLANHAAGVVVGKLGTATVTPEEILKSISQTAGDS